MIVITNGSRRQTLLLLCSWSLAIVDGDETLSLVDVVGKVFRYLSSLAIKIDGIVHSLNDAQHLIKSVASPSWFISTVPDGSRIVNRTSGMRSDGQIFKVLLIVSDRCSSNGLSQTQAEDAVLGRDLNLHGDASIVKKFRVAAHVGRLVRESGRRGLVTKTCSVVEGWVSRALLEAGFGQILKL